MAQNSSPAQPRIPLEIQGIQVNCCKNPNCANFGVPAGQHAIRGISGPYARVASGAKMPLLRCNACGQHIPMKSNLGISEELQRISAYLTPPDPSCPEQTCPNHAIGVSKGQQHYYAYGSTKAGSPRFKCLACGKIFTISKATLRQRKPHRNKDILKFLVNKMPFARICEVCDITMSTLYGKIDLLHRQCLAFVQEREQRLIEGKRDRLYIAVDRQEYIVNWSSRSDRRNLKLTAVGSADLDSGYVFGMHLNFDSSLDAADIERDALKLGDAVQANPFRRYARLWLATDYSAAVATTQKRMQAKFTKQAGTGLAGKIAGAYADVAARDDVETSEIFDASMTFPSQGMQTRLEYTLYAHFYLLHRMFQGVSKVRFYMDQESGIRAAFMAAFRDEVKTHRADAFYVSINKTLTVPNKQAAMNDSRERFKLEQQANPGLTDTELTIKMVVDQLRQAKAIGQYNDLWVSHPFPNMSEPEKAACHLTDQGQYSSEHLVGISINTHTYNT